MKISDIKFQPPINRRIDQIKRTEALEPIIRQFIDLCESIDGGAEIKMAKSCAEQAMSWAWLNLKAMRDPTI